MYFSWVDQNSGSAVLKYSTWEGSWSPPEVVAKGSNWFVNWADYPMIAATKEGMLIAHYLAKSSPGTYSYDINLLLRNEKWGQALVPHKDSTLTEHGFLTIIPLRESFLLAWLDGRNTGAPHRDHHGHQGAMTLRSAVVQADGRLADEVELDDRVCDCCQTTGALTDSGPVVLYRDRSSEEIRDISIIRKVDGKWSEPRTVYADQWEVSGCPVNGPRAVASGNQLAIIWYTAANDAPQVKVIFSFDGGASFGPPLIIDDKNPLGRVDIVWLNSQKVMTSWLGRNDGGETVIQARIVDSRGYMEPVIAVAESSEARGSGFPQMERLDDEVFFAWTVQEAEGNKRIELARLRVN